MKENFLLSERGSVEIITLDMSMPDHSSDVNSFISVWFEDQWMKLPDTICLPTYRTGGVCYTSPLSISIRLGIKASYNLTITVEKFVHVAKVVSFSIKDT